jgi:hypothetical protein
MHHTLLLRQQPQQEMLGTELISLASAHDGLCNLYSFPCVLRKLV